jgi:hypothetical protein
MKSKIAETLKMNFDPVAILWTDSLPEDALQFKGVGGGCIMSMFAQAAAKGKIAAFSRTAIGCFGGSIGLGFGKSFEGYPMGVEAFKYFLSTGIESSGNKEMVEKAKKIGKSEIAELFLKGEGYKKSPELVGKFLENLPDIEVPTKYVVFKPLRDLAEGEEPKVISFAANPDQLSALVTLVNYDKEGNENVIVPWGAGCSQIGIYAFRESESENPRAVIGLTDLDPRMAVRGLLGKDILTLTVPYRMFLDMEANVTGSFLDRSLWKKITRD